VTALVRELRGVDIPLDRPYEGFYRSSHALELYQRAHGRPPADDARELQHWLYVEGFRLTGYDGVWTRECTDELLRREGRMGAWDYTYPWVGAALARLKQAGIRLAVVSNSDGQVVRLLDRLGYAQYLDAIVDSHVEGIAKPDARLFHIALERLVVSGPDLRNSMGQRDGQRPGRPCCMSARPYRADRRRCSMPQPCWSISCVSGSRGGTLSSIKDLSGCWYTNGAMDSGDLRNRMGMIHTIRKPSLHRHLGVCRLVSARFILLEFTRYDSDSLLGGW
jgi:hypothetical protein